MNCLLCKTTSFPFTKWDGRISQCPNAQMGIQNQYPACRMIFKVKSTGLSPLYLNLQFIWTHCGWVGCISAHTYNLKSISFDIKWLKPLGIIIVSMVPEGHLSAPSVPLKESYPLLAILYWHFSYGRKAQIHWEAHLDTKRWVPFEASPSTLAALGCVPGLWGMESPASDPPWPLAAGLLQSCWVISWPDHLLPVSSLTLQPGPPGQGSSTVLAWGNLILSLHNPQVNPSG